MKKIIFIAMLIFSFGLLASCEDNDTITYRIEFNTCGHGEDIEPLVNLTHIPNSLPELKAEGYEFLGWYLDVAYTKLAIPNTVLISDIILYAKWKTIEQSHICNFNCEWQSNESYHWKVCSCGIVGEKNAHSGGESTTTELAKCEVCGQEYGDYKVPDHVHEAKSDWQYDETYHWKECSCGDLVEKNAHSGGESTTTELAKCDVCGQEYGEYRKPSEGLEYKLNEDGQSYSVVGIGTCIDKNIIIPSIFNDLPVTSIGEGAFDLCTKLESIEIPNSVTIIEDEAFATCFSLTKVIFDEEIKFERISSNAFKGCHALNYNEYQNAKYLGNDDSPYLVLVGAIDNTIEKVVVHKQTQIICTSGFANCDALKSVTFEEGIELEIIGKSTFSSCHSLVSIEIPRSVTSIDENAFYSCWSLTSITFEEESQLEIIGKNAFYNCAFNSINIPKSVSTIETYAFKSCYSLTTVIIPTNVTSINTSAFHSCEKLTIYCEAESKPDGWYSSWNYDNRPVYWGVTKEDIIEDNGIQYLIIDGKASITRYIGNATKITIPSTINVNGIQYDVTSIGKSAFSCNSSLTSVEVSTGISSIYGSAFYNCGSLVSITIPESVSHLINPFFSCEHLTIYCEAKSMPNSWDTAWNSDGMPSYWGVTKEDIIEIDDFHYLIIDGEATITRYIGNTENVVIPSNITINGIKYDVTSIGKKSFNYCDSLINLEIPKSVTNIGEHAFRICSYLESVTFENGIKLESVSLGAFEGCDNLNYSEYQNAKYLGNEENPYLALVSANDKSITEVIIHEKTQIICDKAFEKCSNLTTVIIPDCVTNIGYCAFGYCKSLTNVMISDTVISIGKSAFYNCTNLTTIIIPDSVTIIEGYAFYCNSSLTIYCEADVKPLDWSSIWINNNAKVYWKGQWNYDTDGNPVPSE